MRDKCIRLDMLSEEINHAYKTLCVTLGKDNRTSLLASGYEGMAHLLLDTERRYDEITARDVAFEKSLIASFKKANVAYTSVCVRSDREKNTRVTGINLERFPFSSREFIKYIFAECGEMITEPSFDISEKTGVVLEFKRREIINADYSFVGKAKDEEEVNGDTVSFFTTDEGYMYLLLCDGMGSGVRAATASRLSALFLEKMLTAGVKKSVALELLNNVLLSQSDECFSTVDLLEIDKLTGKSTFIKAGSAPTYILRNEKIYRIFSETPPVGILSTFTAESTRFDLQTGDLIIMMSDGAVPAGKENEQLAELIRLDKSKDPATLCSIIAQSAKEANETNDDVTVAVVEVKKNNE